METGTPVGLDQLEHQQIQPEHEVEDVAQMAVVETITPAVALTGNVELEPESSLMEEVWLNLFWSWFSIHVLEF